MGSYASPAQKERQHTAPIQKTSQKKCFAKHVPEKKRHKSPQQAKARRTKEKKRAHTHTGASMASVRSTLLEWPRTRLTGLLTVSLLVADDSGQGDCALGCLRLCLAPLCLLDEPACSVVVPVDESLLKAFMSRKWRATTGACRVISARLCSSWSNNPDCCVKWEGDSNGAGRGRP